MDIERNEPPVELIAIGGFVMRQQTDDLCRTKQKSKRNVGDRGLPGLRACRSNCYKNCSKIQKTVDVVAKRHYNRITGARSV